MRMRVLRMRRGGLPPDPVAAVESQGDVVLELDGRVRQEACRTMGLEGYSR